MVSVAKCDNDSGFSGLGVTPGGGFSAGLKVASGDGTDTNVVDAMDRKINKKQQRLDWAQKRKKVGTKPLAFKPTNIKIGTVRFMKDKPQRARGFKKYQYIAPCCHTHTKPRPSFFDRRWGGALA